MSFLKKLAVAASSGTSLQYPPLDSAYTNVFSTRCLRNLRKLIDRLSNSRLICKIISLLKLEFNILDHTITKANPILPNSFPVIDWAPLVKTSVSIETYSTNNTNQNNTPSRNYHLAGRSVLCVGGRIKLYPEYSQLIENSGGSFIAFHGAPDDCLDKLPQLLEKADMIICPIDCVNHDAFLIVKRYCKYSCKPCVLLDRSKIDTFSTGNPYVSDHSCKRSIQLERWDRLRLASQLLIFPQTDGGAEMNFQHMKVRYYTRAAGVITASLTSRNYYKSTITNIF